MLIIANYREVAAGGLLRDPDDEPILATALAAQAGFIVSLNTRDFPPDGNLLGIRWVTPQSFLAALEAQYPGAALEEQAGGAGRQLP